MQLAPYLSDTTDREIYHSKKSETTASSRQIGYLRTRIISPVAALAGPCTGDRQRKWNVVEQPRGEDKIKKTLEIQQIRCLYTRLVPVSYKFDCLMIIIAGFNISVDINLLHTGLAPIPYFQPTKAFNIKLIITAAIRGK